MIKHIFAQMLKINLFLTFGFFAFASFGQSTDYKIESFQSVYEPLKSYESIAILTEGNLLWEYEFDLNFEFPFYDSFYTRLYYNNDSWGSLTDNQDEGLLLMDYLDGYTFDNVLDTVNITSDVRFSHVDIDDIQAFVIEYAKARFFADPFSDTVDTYMNWQLWFFENGIIEVHFGEMHMDNTPIYEQGKGFFEFTLDGQVDTTSIRGPHMGIANPYDEDDAIGLSGAYNDYEVIGDNYATLSVLPPIGWIIRFVPTGVAVTEPNIYEDLHIIPNPATTSINLPYTSGIVQIINSIGIIVYEHFNESENIDVSSLPAGTYFIRFLSKDKSSFGSFVKL